MVNSSLRPLQQGDLIDVVAPGSASSEEFLETGIHILESYGFKVRYSENMLKPELFLANSDQYRFQDLKRALLAKDSKAIWCLRGGYGCIRLLPSLAKLEKPKTKKLLIGMSDITSLHLYLNQKWNWPTLHAPLLDRIGQYKINPTNLEEIITVLKEPLKMDFSNLIALNDSARKSKKVTGSVRGGNLVVAASTLGTPYQIKSKNCILFFEEIGEKAYRIDRLLQQFKQAGVFDQAKAVVFGDFTNCEEVDGRNLIQATLESFFKDLKIPALTGVKAGHDVIQRPIFLNTHAQLACGHSARMLVYPGYEVL